MKSALKDPMEQPAPPDRVNYAIGTLLGADDFLDEQSYHRGRLARALAVLHGSGAALPGVANGFGFAGGTALGLKVDWVKASPNQEEELDLSPGLAIDRLGRLIEVPRKWCLRLQKWYDAQPEDALRSAFQAASNAVICDLFLRFDNDPRGQTPSFARTTFDSLNATTNARNRDAFYLDLIPRATPSDPDQVWAGLAPGANAQAVQDAILGAPFGTDFDGRAWVPLSEHKGGIDPLAILLARIPIPADAPPAAAGKPARKANVDVKPNNRIRRFVYAPSILGRLAGL